MRAREFIFEDRIPKLRQIFLPKLEPIAQRFGAGADNIFDLVYDYDPTSNKQFMQWMLTIITRTSNPAPLEDLEIAKDELPVFIELVKTRQLTGNQANIMNYKTFRDLEAVTKKEDLRVSVSDSAQEQKARKESDVLYEDQEWIVLVPKTEFASQYWGRDTEWCTAWGSDMGKHPSRACQYAAYTQDENELYIFYNKQDFKKNIQLDFKSQQYMNYQDRRIDLNILKAQYPIFFNKIESRIAKKPRQAYEYAYNIIKRRWPEAEPVIMKNPKLAYEYAMHIINGRWREAEPMIMKDPELAFWYADNVIRGRWREAEPSIMTNAYSAYRYSRDIIKGRWREAEPVIMTDPGSAYWYSRSIIKGRWREAEPVIMTNPMLAHLYAKYIIKDRWPEAEPVIMKNPEFAYEYAYYSIRGRWKEAEPVIMKNPKSAYEYAIDVVQGRWPEAEPYIRENPTIWEMYSQRFDL